MAKFSLTIDGGNTLVKYALFNSNDELIEKVDGAIESLVQKHNLTKLNTVCASVNVARARKELDGFKCYNVCDFFNNNKFLEMPVFYSETLGVDRLILAYLFFDNNRSSALVDSGTYTTVDLVNADGFQGGHILPGLGLLADSYSFGFNLDKHRPKEMELTKELLPKTSFNAMSSGLMHTFIDPIRSILDSIAFDNVYFTGGNGEKLHNELKNHQFQQSASILFDSDLIHKALLKFLKRVNE
ncbi:MAG: type III pantothenate kinase [Bacteriovoracaceae bacterium]|nr:type III pantothenate kinase [Bacteriovoracaceae bacterium]